MPWMLLSENKFLTCVENEMSVLHHACCHGHKEVVTYLCQRVTSIIIGGPHDLIMFTIIILSFDYYTSY